MRKHCSKRKDGRWQYSKQKNGMKWYAIAKTYRELIAKIPNIKPKLIKQFKNSRNKATTFIKFFESYIETYVKPLNIKEDTKKEWIYHLEHYIKPYIQKIPIENITAEHLQNIINNIDKERTREKVLQKLKKVIQKAYLSGKIKTNLSIALEKPKRTKIEERPPLTYEEQVLFLKKAKQSKQYAFFMFSIIVGSRREETLKFNINTDLDEVSKTIHIKGTKTKNADRKVNVTQQFIEFLKRNLKDGVFKYHKDYYTKITRKIFKKVGINNCLHGLRHTCAANLYFLGAPDKYRQMQLGHSSIVTTNDIYTNIKENIPKAKLIELYGDLYPKFD